MQSTKDKVPKREKSSCQIILRSDKMGKKYLIEFSNMVIITIPFERCSIKRLEHKSQII